MTAERPILITIVGVLNIALGLLAIALGVILAADLGGITTDIANRVWDEIIAQEIDVDFTKDQIFNALKMAGALPIIVGIINAVIGIGMLLGWRIMWYIGVIVNILELAFGVLTLFVGNFGAIISILINALIVYYLFRPGVKAFFSV